MILKSFELNKIDLKLNKHVLFYGKNDGSKQEEINNVFAEGNMRTELSDLLKAANPNEWLQKRKEKQESDKGAKNQGEESPVVLFVMAPSGGGKTFLRLKHQAELGIKGANFIQSDGAMIREKHKKFAQIKEFATETLKSSENTMSGGYGQMVFLIMPGKRSKRRTHN